MFLWRIKTSFLLAVGILGVWLSGQGYIWEREKYVLELSALPCFTHNRIRARAHLLTQTQPLLWKATCTLFSKWWKASLNEAYCASFCVIRKCYFHSTGRKTEGINDAVLVRVICTHKGHLVVSGDIHECCNLCVMGRYSWNSWVEAMGYCWTACCTQDQYSRYLYHKDFCLEVVHLKAKFILLSFETLSSSVFFYPHT